MRARLAVMMFLQFAVWGAWAPVLWPWLTDSLGFSQTQAGWIFATLWLACLLAPFTGGQLADRWVRSEWLLARAHLLGGAVLLALGVWAERGASFGVWMAMMGLYALLYAPTLAVSNSIALRHLASDTEFGRVRVFGTLGWIVSGGLLTLWRSGAMGLAPRPSDCLLLAGALSVVLGLYSLALPKTPPARTGGDPLAFRRALVLLKERNTLVFLAIAFVVTTELQFYYGPTAGFLESAVKIEHARVPLTMSVAQMAELAAMALGLRWALRRWGLRKTLAIGVVAWPARYLVFAAAPHGPLEIMRPLVVGSLTLHGLGFTFFFVASQVFIDRVAPPDVRASAQSLLNFATLGLGNFLGTLFTAQVMDHFTAAGATNWSGVFAVPCVLTLACAAAFLLFVEDPQTAASS